MWARRCVQDTPFNHYELNGVVAPDLKVIGFGRFNRSGDTRKSVRSTIGEIEFYGSETTSTRQHAFDNQILAYPNPAQNHLYLDNIDEVLSIRIYGIGGRQFLNQTIAAGQSTAGIDISSLPRGAYALTLIGNAKRQSIPFVVLR